MPLTEQQVFAKLKECYDPEIPCNIVDLGFVYGVKLAPLAGDKTRVEVTMTLTVQGCPMASRIAVQVQHKLLELAGVGEANVKLVFDPPWDRSRITPEGLKTLGME
ncbi:MAG: iron-sulfur cluster assembly protein [Verrucomicrobiia bacterium]